MSYRLSTKAGRRAFFFACSALVISSCAFAPKVVQLNDFEPNSMSKLSAETCIRVEKLKDERKNPHVLGYNRTGLGTKAGEVTTPQELAAWVTNHLSEELHRAGAGDCKGVVPYVLTGVIKDASVDEYWNVSSEIRVDLQLSKNGTVIFKDSFVGSSKQTSWAASASEFTDSFYKALTDLSSKVITRTSLELHRKTQVGETR